MISKKIVLSAAAILTVFGLTQVANSQQQPINNVKPELSAPNLPKKGVAPKIRLDDNSQGNRKFISREQAIGTIPENAELKSAKMAKLSESEQEISGGALESAEIHPNRKVWVVVYNFPLGLKTRVYKFDKATVTKIVDAESGEVLSSQYEAPPGAAHLLREKD